MIGEDILNDVYKFINLRALSESICLINRMSNEISDKLIKAKATPRIVDNLSIGSGPNLLVNHDPILRCVSDIPTKPDSFSKYDVVLKCQTSLSISDKAPDKNILGFGNINFFMVDYGNQTKKALQFLNMVKHLLGEHSLNILPELLSPYWPNNDPTTSKLDILATVFGTLGEFFKFVLLWSPSDNLLKEAQIMAANQLVVMKSHKCVQFPAKELSEWLFNGNGSSPRILNICDFCDVFSMAEKQSLYQIVLEDYFAAATSRYFMVNFGRINEPNFGPGEFFDFEFPLLNENEESLMFKQISAGADEHVFLIRHVGDEPSDEEIRKMFDYDLGKLLTIG